MSIDRYNCFGGSCAAASAQMLAAIIAWRDRIADMIPKVPQNVGLSTKITEQQILQWMQSDQATIPAADREFVKYASFHQLHNAGVSFRMGALYT
jgi:hypothetical protein